MSKIAKGFALGVPEFAIEAAECALLWQQGKRAPHVARGEIEEQLLLRAALLHPRDAYDGVRLGPW